MKKVTEKKIKGEYKTNNRLEEELKKAENKKGKKREKTNR